MSSFLHDVRWAVMEGISEARDGFVAIAVLWRTLLKLSKGCLTRQGESKTLYPVHSSSSCVLEKVHIHQRLKTHIYSNVKYSKLILLKQQRLCLKHVQSKQDKKARSRRVIV